MTPVQHTPPVQSSARDVSHWTVWQPGPHLYGGLWSFPRKWESWKPSTTWELSNHPGPKFHLPNLFPPSSHPVPSPFWDQFSLASIFHFYTYSNFPTSFQFWTTHLPQAGFISCLGVAPQFSKCVLRHLRVPQWIHSGVCGYFKFSQESQEHLWETSTLRESTVSTLDYYTASKDQIMSKQGFR